MTPEERKRGLRAAVQAKIDLIWESKIESLKVLNVTSNQARIIQDGWQLTIMWEVIDSLVDEVAEYAEAVQPADSDEHDRVSKRSYRIMLNLIGHDVGLATPQQMNPVALTRAIRQLVRGPEAGPGDCE